MVSFSALVNLSPLLVVELPPPRPCRCGRGGGPGLPVCSDKRIESASDVVSHTGSLPDAPLTRTNARTHHERAHRKKAVFILPAFLSVSGVGGKLGTIAKMDTQFPVLYIDFPTGRVKVQGRIVEPKATLMPLTFKKKGPAIVKASVKTVIVFSKTSWIGTKKENPDETPLPMPEGMQVK